MSEGYRLPGGPGNPRSRLACDANIHRAFPARSPKETGNPNMTELPRQSLAPLLKALYTLRWLAIGSLTVMLVIAERLAELSLPRMPALAALGLLALFNLYAGWRCKRADAVTPVEAFGHILVDVVVLACIIGWTGGIANPFGSLFLLPIALATLAMPLRWTLATAAACVAGYMGAAVFGRPLTHLHGGAIDLHLWGMAANFIVSAAVVLLFSTRLIAAREQREQEIAAIRERFTRNEGILALATHAASVAHELSTPLGTLTLLLEDAHASAGTPLPPDDLATMRALVDVCRERVRELAQSADPDAGSDVALDRVLAHWQLVRPSITLHRSIDVPGEWPVDRGIGHLLLVLLNNAADAGESNGYPRVDLTIQRTPEGLRGEIRDYGPGFSDVTLLPALLKSSKPEGLGVGLALSHATIERLGGTLSIQSTREGARVIFEIPTWNDGEHV